MQLASISNLPEEQFDLEAKCPGETSNSQVPVHLDMTGIFRMLSSWRDTHRLPVSASPL